MKWLTRFIGTLACFLAYHEFGVAKGLAYILWALVVSVAIGWVADRVLVDAK